MRSETAPVGGVYSQSDVNDTLKNRLWTTNLVNAVWLFIWEADATITETDYDVQTHEEVGSTSVPKTVFSATYKCSPQTVND